MWVPLVQVSVADSLSRCLMRSTRLSESGAVDAESGAARAVSALATAATAAPARAPGQRMLVEVLDELVAGRLEREERGREAAGPGGGSGNVATWPLRADRGERVQPGSRIQRSAAAPCLFTDKRGGELEAEGGRDKEAETRSACSTFLSL